MIPMIRIRDWNHRSARLDAEFAGVCALYDALAAQIRWMPPPVKRWASGVLARETSEIMRPLLEEKERLGKEFDELHGDLTFNQETI